MNKEEKEAIKEAKKLIEEEAHNLNDINVFMTDSTTLKILLNYIDKLQNELASKKKQIKLMQQCDLAKELHKLEKENEELKEKINKVVLMIDDNYRSEWYDDYETIVDLRDDIYDLLKIKYKGVKE